MSEVRPPATAREATLAAVAAEVHDRRAALKLSVRAAARRCGVSPTVIFEVEIDSGSRRWSRTRSCARGSGSRRQPPP